MKTFTAFFTTLAICIVSVKTILPQQSIPTPEEFLKSIHERILLNGDSSLNIILNHSKKESRIQLVNPYWSDWLKSDFTIQIWNGGSWANDSSEIYTYNEYSLLSEKLIRDWTNFQWLNEQRYFYNYNTSLALSEDILQRYSNGVWIDSLKNVYTYNPSGQLTTINTYIWNNSVWENYELTTSTYSNNQLVEDLFQVWNGNGWDNSSRSTYTYDANSINITSAIWLFGSWVNVLRIGFYYDDIGLIVELRMQYWDFFSGWVNLTHLLFTYDSNFNIIIGLWQDWDTGTSSWINYSRTTSTYHSGNIPINDLTELWIDNGWIYDSQRTYQFDGNSNLSQIIDQMWEGTWVNYRRQLFSYTTDVANGQFHPVNFQLLQNYPNPFNPSTKISWQSPVGGWQTLKIYDVLGNEVATLVDEYKPAGSYEVEWNASNYPSGVYFYQLKTNTYQETKKTILLR